MIPNKELENNLDALVKGALTDDLPTDAAAGMRVRIAQVRAGLAEGKIGAADRIWILPKSVWATLAVLMLAAGCLLQGLRSPSPLAEQIARIKTQTSISEPARPAVPEKTPAGVPGEKEA